MFSPNLGKAERAFRLVVGAVLAAWVLVQPEPGAVEAIAGIAALFLVLNALSARCYLWRALGLNSCQRPAGER